MLQRPDAHTASRHPRPTGSVDSGLAGSGLDFRDVPATMADGAAAGNGPATGDCPVGIAVRRTHCDLPRRIGGGPVVSHGALAAGPVSIVHVGPGRPPGNAALKADPGDQLVMVGAAGHVSTGDLPRIIADVRQLSPRRRIAVSRRTARSRRDRESCHHSRQTQQPRRPSNHASLRRRCSSAHDVPSSPLPPDGADPARYLRPAPQRSKLSRNSHARPAGDAGDEYAPAPTGRKRRMRPNAQRRPGCPHLVQPRADSACCALCARLGARITRPVRDIPQRGHVGKKPELAYAVLS